MSRLLVIAAGLLAILLVPLALSGPTALLLIPAHLAFAVVVCTGALLDGFDGCPARARRWSLVFLVATVAMIGALQLGADVRGLAMGYWGIPWLGTLLWAWIPPVVCEIAGGFGSVRRETLTRRTISRRTAAQLQSGLGAGSYAHDYGVREQVTSAPYDSASARARSRGRV